jgi:hypothetical protein
MAGDNLEQQVAGVLFNVPKNTLKAESPPEAYLEQYKIYLETLDRISERRQTANSFFLSLNTGICGLLGYLFSKDSDPELKCFCWILPVAGIFLSVFWLRLVTSYRQLNTGKFVVLHLVEKHLPLAPYGAEWIALAKGKDRKVYLPLTHVEVWIPRLFILMYIIFIVIRLPLIRWLSMLL